ncbi:hypothetical protein [Streptomyces clavuligerus]|uniref:Uncharacterized protein n=1 Tax=Streptomyces clavuligerus TaxID=1901 RepID=E2PZJ0_STRCL|nr:hypothetical protein [Streptomyces clavuligerus]ANW20683.1 hypothetical protein BB341_21975 [Streptomyces clavuligerus]EFG06299.1 Hypothetical protein SCLAV_1221 [Streptomyces clavuligerus]MBY6305397.1 hypothetical protein [Streptomyces clavuligerus]QPJ92574.1 hypothetical protein GE265_05880 [Streptomyces clavuligerus]QPL65312.1 hypothetical protein I3J04_22270 [Streptomyces clavuligerus]
MDKSEANKNRTLLGTCAGVSSAVMLLPGVSTVGETAAVWPVLASVVLFVVVNQLVVTLPADVRRTPPPRLLALGAAGVVQDALILWGIHWIAGQVGYGLEAASLASVLLGGLIVRVVTLGFLALPVPGRVADARTR